MKQLILFLVLAIVLSACSSGRRAHDRMMKKAPQWVTQAPNNPSYFHGVGVAAKTPQFDYRERARQIALSELAAGISVNISSASVLNMFEFDNVSSEFFLDNINMSVQQYLEGYELVEQWESNQQYWVYYRLSKIRHQQLKQERTERALSISRSKFEQARSFANQGKTSDAMGFYVRAFEDIRDFVAEDLTTNIDGQNQPYATVLMTDITSKIRDLRVVFPLETLSVKPGSEMSLQPIEPVLINSMGEPAAGIPVIIRSSWQPGRRIEAVTDARGRLRITPQGIKPGIRSGEIICMLDLDRLVRQNSSDIFVHRFFEVVRPNSFSLPVNIISPVFHISSQSPGQERVTATQTSNARILDEITRILRQEGLDVTQDRQRADYTLVFKSQANNPVQHGNRYSVVVRAIIEVKDYNDRTLFQTNLDDVTGLGSSPAQAIDDAYNSLRGKFSIGVLDRMMQTLF